MNGLSCGAQWGRCGRLGLAGAEEERGGGRICAGEPAAVAVVWAARHAEGAWVAFWTRAAGTQLGGAELGLGFPGVLLFGRQSGGLSPRDEGCSFNPPFQGRVTLRPAPFLSSLG